MSNFDFLADLQKLKDIAEGGVQQLPITRLEAQFIKFSSIRAGCELEVRMPKLYNLEGDEACQFKELLKVAGREQFAVPKAIGLGGEFFHDVHDDLLIFMSPEQIHAEYFSRGRVHLNPLVEKVYTNGAGILRDFAVHEGLFGKVKYIRGELDLKELHVFPDKFTSGYYEMRVKLDTPRKSVSKFKELTDLLLLFRAEPKKNILSPENIQKATGLALELRGLLGSLSRYELPLDTFVARTGSCVLRDDDKVHYHIYSPEQRKNIIVYFGEAPLEKGQEVPKDLIVLDGDEQHNTLSQLFALGVYTPSRHVLSERIATFDSAFEESARKARKSLKGNYPDFEVFMTKLREISASLETMQSLDRRIQYASKLSPELLEFMACPSSEDPVLSELLPKLSWNSGVRRYNQTKRFIDAYRGADEPEKIRILGEVASNITFAHQMNNDVNLWLYKNERDFCEKNGIVFKVV